MDWYLFFWVMLGCVIWFGAGIISFVKEIRDCDDEEFDYYLENVHGEMFAAIICGLISFVVIFDPFRKIIVRLHNTRIKAHKGIAYKIRGKKNDRRRTSESNADHS